MCVCVCLFVCLDAVLEAVEVVVWRCVEVMQWGGLCSEGDLRVHV